MEALCGCSADDLWGISREERVCPSMEFFSPMVTERREWKFLMEGRIRGEDLEDLDRWWLSWYWKRVFEFFDKEKFLVDNKNGTVVVETCDSKFLRRLEM